MSADMHGARADARKRAAEAGSTPDDRDAPQFAAFLNRALENPEVAATYHAAQARESLVDLMVPAMGDECSLDELRAYAVRILTSDWLVEHDRQVAAKIAEAIEDELVCGCEGDDPHGGGICYWGSAAADIARSFKGGAA